MSANYVERIFADYAAGGAVDDAVLAEMLPYFGAAYANPSAKYEEGVRAKAVLEAARKRVATALGAHPDEIFFTSGATEADNWVLRCAVGEHGGIVTSALEHPAVLETCRTLAAAGRNVAYADVLSNGEVSLPSLGERLAEMNDCSLVTLMYANHETGVIQPVGQAAAMARMHGALLLCDAVQALSTQKVDVHALGVDFLSISGHKLGAPRGIGALYVRRGLKLSPLHTGGGQESGRRSGTESVALAVGLARALELCAERRVENERIRNNSQRLLALLSDIPGTTVNGWNDPDKQLPGIVNVSFDCVDGGALVLWLDRMGICVSAGSACSSAGKHPSAVLLAMGREERMAMSSLRISLGPKNTAEQVEKIAAEICRGVEILRSLDLVGSSKYTQIGTK